MARPDFGQRETALKQALGANRSLLALLLGGLLVLGALALVPCATRQASPTLVAGSADAGLVTASIPQTR